MTKAGARLFLHAGFATAALLLFPAASSRAETLDQLYEKAKLDPAGIPAIMAQYRRGLQFKADHEPKFILTPQGRLIEELMKFAGELAKLAEPLGFRIVMAVA